MTKDEELKEYILAGYCHKHIARLCGKSVITIKTYFTRIYAELGVTNRTQAVIKLMKRQEFDERIKEFK